MGQEGFRWFIGIVEDYLNDPAQLGRVKVRAFGIHDDNISTEQLPWAQVLIPTTAGPAQNGVGVAPVGLGIGSRVVGFFIDGEEHQFPMVLGAFHTIPQMDQAKHGVSPLARGTNTVRRTKVGPEPKSEYNAEYPYNRVIQTASGHVVEIDDTPGHERINVQHKSGSYIEISPDGKMVIKSASDMYEINAGKKTIYSAGDIDIVSGGDIALIAKNGIKLSAAAGVTQTKGNLFVKGLVTSTAAATGVFTSPSGKQIYVENGIVASIES
jgi:hypothetical protein